MLALDIAIIIIMVYIVYQLVTASTKGQQPGTEAFADPYSLALHADAVNKQKRWNLYGSRQFASINGYIEPAIEYDCYYSLWNVNDRLS